jgi:hypothetical protein
MHEDHGRRGQGERGGQAREHQREGRLLVTQRAAEITLGRAPEEEAVLLGQRTIEAERRAQDLVVLLGALGAHVERGGVAREVHDHEHDPRDAEEDEECPRESLAEIRDHIRLLTLVRDCSMCSIARALYGNSQTSVVPRPPHPILSPATGERDERNVWSKALIPLPHGGRGQGEGSIPHMVAR